MQIVAVGDRLTNPDTHPRRETNASPKDVEVLDRSLDLSRRAQRAKRALEARHRPVAERLHQPPAGAGDGSAHILHMRAAKLLHPVVAQPHQQRRRIDEVAEEHDPHPAHVRTLRAHTETGAISRLCRLRRRRTPARRRDEGGRQPAEDFPRATVNRSGRVTET